MRLGSILCACVSIYVRGGTFSCGVRAVISGRGQGQFLKSFQGLGSPDLPFPSVSECLWYSFV